MNKAESGVGKADTGLKLSACGVSCLDIRFHNQRKVITLAVDNWIRQIGSLINNIAILNEQLEKKTIQSKLQEKDLELRNTLQVNIKRLVT